MDVLATAPGLEGFCPGADVPLLTRLETARAHLTPSGRESPTDQRLETGRHLLRARSPSQATSYIDCSRRARRSLRYRCCLSLLCSVRLPRADGFLNDSSQKRNCLSSAAKCSSRCRSHSVHQCKRLQRGCRTRGVLRCVTQGGSRCAEDGTGWLCDRQGGTANGTRRNLLRGCAHDIGASSARRPGCRPGGGGHRAARCAPRLQAGFSERAARDESSRGRANRSPGACGALWVPGALLPRRGQTGTGNHGEMITVFRRA